MSASETLTKAAAMNVRLWIDGEHIRIAGPASNVAAIKPEIAACKCAIMNAMRAVAQTEIGDCAGTLIDPDGGAYLPWGPYLSADDVRRMRGELFDLIEAISTLEGWPREALDDVVARATCGPLSNLVPNLRYFNERLQVLKAQKAARNEMAGHAWRLEGFDDRRA